MGRESNTYKYKVCVRCMTYNQTPYIKDTLRGFINQRFSFPTVFTIVDDASSDGEQDVLREWSSQNLFFHDDDCVFSKQKTYGELIVGRLKSNINALYVIILLKDNHRRLRRNKVPYLLEWWNEAEYHAICEGDDYWICPDKLQMQVDFLDKEPEYVLVRTNINRYHQNDGVMEERFFDDSKLKDTFKDYLQEAWFAAPCTWMFRVEAYFGAYEESRKIIRSGGFGGDLALILYFSDSGKIKYMDEVTAVYRVLDHSISHFIKNEDSDVFTKRIRKTQRWFASKKSISTRINLEFFFLKRTLKKKLKMIKILLNKNT